MCNVNVVHGDLRLGTVQQLSGVGGGGRGRGAECLVTHRERGQCEIISGKERGDI